MHVDNFCTRLFMQPVHVLCDQQNMPRPRGL